MPFSAFHFPGRGHLLARRYCLTGLILCMPPLLNASKVTRGCSVKQNLRQIILLIVTHQDPVKRPMLKCRTWQILRLVIPTYCKVD